MVFIKSKIWGSCYRAKQTLARDHVGVRRLAHTYAFVGLGRMGHSMAQNLLDKLEPTDHLIIHDVNAEAVDKFLQTNEKKHSNLRKATDNKEFTERADTVITMLPSSPHVLSFVNSINPKNEKLTKDNSSLPPSRLFIDCSTIDPAASLEASQKLFNSGIGHYVDAPASGGEVGAREGTLTFMIGAPKDLYNQIQSVLSKMGKNFFHCGGPTTGLAAKLVNNYILALTNLATAEAFNMGLSMGLDAALLSKIVDSSSGQSWTTTRNNPIPGILPKSPASNHYKPGFSIELMHKDLQLAIAAAELCDADLTLAKRAQEVYGSALENKTYSGKDFSVLFKYFQDRSASP